MTTKQDKCIHIQHIHVWYPKTTRLMIYLHTADRTLLYFRSGLITLSIEIINWSEETLSVLTSQTGALVFTYKLRPILVSIDSFLGTLCSQKLTSCQCLTISQGIHKSPLYMFGHNLTQWLKAPKSQLEIWNSLDIFDHRYIMSEDYRFWYDLLTGSYLFLLKCHIYSLIIWSGRHTESNTVN